MKIVKFHTYRESMLRSLCRRVLRGHSKVGRQGVICVLPSRTVGNRTLRELLVKGSKSWEGASHGGAGVKVAGRR